MTFRENSMLCTVELAGPIARVQRCSETSQCHTYDWLFSVATTTLANIEVHRVEEERRKATLPNAVNPLTPAVPTAKQKATQDKQYKIDVQKAATEALQKH